MLVKPSNFSRLFSSSIDGYLAEAKQNQSRHDRKALALTALLTDRLYLVSAYLRRRIFLSRNSDFLINIFTLYHA